MRGRHLCQRLAQRAAVAARRPLQGLCSKLDGEKTACEYKSAKLEIKSNKRYSLTTRCDRGKGIEEVVTGSWWIDEIAGSCLSLMHEPPPLHSDDERWYGFRIGDNASSLSQDGSQCTSADERNNGMILSRVPKGKS